ncbi:MAG TPA: EamA family transporter [Candidatus Saccharimonadia bacterium]|nr:EamA family transporter [Candidatus Saccharimonadia bacterium]
MLLIIAALVAALGYGTANFLGGLASRRQPAAITMFLSQITTFFMVCIMAPQAGGRPGSLMLGATAGVLAFAGALLAYVCFSLGRPIGVAAALLGTTAAAVPVIAGCATGRPPSALAAAGLALALAAVVVLGWPRETRTDLRVALLAAGSGTAFGIYHVLISHTDHTTAFWPLLASQTVVAVLAWGAVVVTRSRPAGPVAIRLSVGDGLASTVATVAALAAVRSGSLAVAGTVIALSPAATVLLSRIFLAERLHRTQAAGLAAALAAIVLLTLPQ